MYNTIEWPATILHVISYIIGRDCICSYGAEGLNELKLSAPAHLEAEPFMGLYHLLYQLESESLQSHKLTINELSSTNISNLYYLRRCASYLTGYN